MARGAGMSLADKIMFVYCQNGKIDNARAVCHFVSRSRCQFVAKNDEGAIDTPG